MQISSFKIRTLVTKLSFIMQIPTYILRLLPFAVSISFRFLTLLWSHRTIGWDHFWRSTIFQTYFLFHEIFFSFRVCTVWIKETIKENQRATLYPKTRIALILLAYFDKQSTIWIQNWLFSHYNFLACMLQCTENQLFAHENTKKIKRRIISKISACPKGCFPIKILLEYN